LYKKGDVYSIQIYRPISILTIFSKILEKLMYSRLIIFLNKRNIVTEVQNGFRKMKFTTRAIQSFIERIQEALNNGLQAIGIFFYLTQEYDVLNHRVLKNKLYSYGVEGNIISWFRYFSTGILKYY
jgi:histidyl-tRNA synthetase